MSTRRAFCLSLLIGTLAVAGVSAARQAASGELTSQDGVRLMRVLNTAQAQIKSRVGTYMSLRDVVTDRSFGSSSLAVQIVEADAANVRSYRLSMTRSDDLQRYQAALVPLSGCGPAWFTNESGLIFTGRCLE